MAKSDHDKALQQAMLQGKRPEMRRLETEALHKAGRTDLIGYGKDCLIRPLHGGQATERPAAGQRETPGRAARPEERRGKGPTRREGKPSAAGKSRYGATVPAGKPASSRVKGRSVENGGKAPSRGAARGSAAARRSGSRDKNPRRR